ncbi:MAG TPA: glycoside hydrolase family 172 protein [Bryobacteraceae bacterium]|nr:glycoside hydrolase family 172 protein [Bryobacteraceae bacterium]
MSMHFPSEHEAPRRGFLQRLAGLAGITAAAASPAAAQGQRQGGRGDFRFLPRYTRAQNYKSLKQSSYDRTGGNSDRWPIKPGDSIDVFHSPGPGVISHIWFTIAAQSMNHLKEVVIRMYWDGNAKPSVEVPVGDFFGLNLGQYFIYQSAFLNCSSVKALNCYFAMPFRKSARITASNEGKQDVSSFYSNIDYQLWPELPADALYFHAQYRQGTPNHPTTNDWKSNGDANRLKNLDGKMNYVYGETRGRGHLMGVTLGVLQNQEFWMGEGDEMIFVDDESKPIITGTGSEDYFCGAWDFGGRDAAIPFAHLYNGAPFIQSPERTGGRYCLYRWHADNPVTFTRYLKHTMEHGHANHRADNFYSVCYWYQTEPYTDFPPLPPAEERIPVMKAVPGPGGAQPT